jgi:hypothetical protein
MAIPWARYSICAALVCLVSGGATSTLGQDRLSERVLTSIGPEDVIFFASPKPNAGRLRFLLTFIARSARVPIGFEELAGIPVLDDGDLSTIPFSARTDLTGLSVGDALDALVSADPRYSWREQDGVIMIRPVQAWADPGHFLHQRFSGFHMRDSTAADVARAIYERLGAPIRFGEGGVFGDPPDSEGDLEKRIDFEVPSGTIVEALNSVVRAYGGLGWMVHYANAPADIRTSCVRFVTFDGKFTGVGAAGCHPGAEVK